MFFLLTSCSDDSDRIIEIPGDSTRIEISPQQQFAGKLRMKGLLERIDSSRMYEVIHNIIDSTRFSQAYQINSSFDTGNLNVFVIDSKKDSSLRNICAYAGNRTVFLDGDFLRHGLDDYSFYQALTVQQKARCIENFQRWVIGHEIGHADLLHEYGHFITTQKVKEQSTAKQFHGLELAADERSLHYWPTMNKENVAAMLLGIFNAEYDKLYGSVKRPKHYMQVIDDPYVTYAYRLDGSHPSMPVRCAIMMYLMKMNKELDAETHLFLVQSQLTYIEEIARHQLQ